LNVKVIVFDLDDTLYDEIEFVKSGFYVVSKYFANKYNLQISDIYNLFVEELNKNGRGKIFDEVFNQLNIFTKYNISKALNIYRTHSPKISLPFESIQILNYLKSNNIPLYIVTDGNKIVQNNKIEALDLRKYIKKDFITHRFGKKYAKPSTYCFEKIAKLEKKDFKDIVYIADNPNKDFVNIKKLGFRTIRLKKGMFIDLIKTEDFEAEFTIKNLFELKNIIVLQKN